MARNFVLLDLHEAVKLTARPHTIVYYTEGVDLKIITNDFTTCRALK